MFEVLTILAFGIALIGAILLAVALYSGLLRTPQQLDPAGSKLPVPCSDGTQRTLHLPSAGYVNTMGRHVERRRAELAKYLKGSMDDLASWRDKSNAQRRSVLLEQAGEVQLAVSGYADRSLFLDLCPELAAAALEELATDAAALRRFASILAANGWPSPPASSQQVKLINTAIAEHLKSSDTNRQDRGVRSGFLATFRRSCLLAFAHATLQEAGEAGRKRADTRAQERKAFLQRIGRGAGYWALGAIAMRILPEVLQAAFDNFYL